MSHPEISILGAGGWGTALALVMARRGSEVTVWGHDPDHVALIDRTRSNEKYLSGIEIPSSIRFTASLSECSRAGVIFVAVPSRHLSEVASNLSAAGVTEGGLVVSCTKGIEEQRGLLMSEILSEKLPASTVAVLSGPNLAGEIARGIPAAGVIGCLEEEPRNRLLGLFEGTRFRAYSSGDVRGIQLGGALKNIFAIAAGISDGLGLGENARAALVTRSLAEMTRLGVAMGGKRETFQGLSGVGDLMVTCFSSRSRNHHVGFRLGQGESTDAIRSSMTMVAEGIPTATSAQGCARRLGVETPIIDEVVSLLHAEKSASEGMHALLSRELRSEE